MTSEWWARPGSGPIHEATTIANTGGGDATIGYQPTFALNLTKPTGSTTTMWDVNTDGAAPDATGIQEPSDAGAHSVPAYRSHGGKRFDSAGRLRRRRQLPRYGGTEWSYGDINVAGTSSPSDCDNRQLPGRGPAHT